MIENPFAEFMLELVRALLVDELSGHVRRRLGRILARRAARDSRRIILRVHQRNRQRLLNRMFTEPHEGP